MGAPPVGPPLYSCLDVDEVPQQDNGWAILRVLTYVQGIIFCKESSQRRPFEDHLRTTWALILEDHMNYTTTTTNFNYVGIVVLLVTSNNSYILSSNTGQPPPCPKCRHTNNHIDDGIIGRGSAACIGHVGYLHGSQCRSTTFWQHDAGLENYTKEHSHWKTARWPISSTSMCHPSSAKNTILDLFMECSWRPQPHQSAKQLTRPVTGRNPVIQREWIGWNWKTIQSLNRLPWGCLIWTGGSNRLKHGDMGHDLGSVVMV